MRYIIEYDWRTQTYRILDYEDKLQNAEPVAIKTISAEAMNKIIELFIEGYAKGGD